MAVIVLSTAIARTRTMHYSPASKEVLSTFYTGEQENVVPCHWSTKLLCKKRVISPNTCANGILKYI